MNLEPFAPRFRAAISDMARMYSIAEPGAFDTSTVFQSPEDMLAWTPAHVPTHDEIDWMCKRVGAFLFFAAPYKDAYDLETWREQIGAQISIREWLPSITQEKYVVCTARRFNDSRFAPVVGASSRDDRLAQIVYNLKTHKGRVKVPLPAHDTPLVLICYGPSLQDTWRHAVAEAKAHGADIACNSGAHDFLIERGCVPKFHVEIDPREERAEFTQAPHQDVEYLIASVCHPKLTDKLSPFNTKLFHLYDGSECQEIFVQEPESVLTDGGSCVALRSLSLFYQLGYRHYSIYGFDCSFKNDMQWAGKHPGKAHKLIEIQVTGSERVFKSSRALETYANQFFEHVQRLPDCNIKLNGDGLLQEWARMNYKLEMQKIKEAAA